jgi:hypothetical protein
MRTYYKLTDEDRAKARATQALQPRKMPLSCGHARYYRPPLPAPLDIVYCVRCEDYAHALGRTA